MLNVTMQFHPISEKPRWPTDYLILRKDLSLTVARYNVCEDYWFVWNDYIQDEDKFTDSEIADWIGWRCLNNEGGD